MSVDSVLRLGVLMEVWMSEHSTGFLPRQRHSPDPDPDHSRCPVLSQVGSRRVLQTTGILMILLGIFGKFGAVFITIPEPVIGGMFLVMFGMIAAVGISNLQVDI